MSITIENLEGLKRKMTIVLSKDEIEPKYNEKIRQYARTAKMPGFRPGKVPLHILESKMGKSLCFEVLSKLMESHFVNAVDEKKLKIAGQPQVYPGQNIKKDQPFEFSVTFEVYPEIELQSLEGMTLTVPEAEISNADIEETEKDIQKQHAKWAVVDRVATTGDRLIIDFEGFLDGKKPFEGNKAEDFVLELETNQLIPGFEEQLIGCRAGDKKDVQVTFPEDYRPGHLAGQPAVFHVSVKKVEAASLPEFNDAFAKELKMDNVSVLKEKIRHTMKDNLERQIQKLRKTRVLKLLLEKNPIDVPQALVDMEIENLQNAAKVRFEQTSGKKWPQGEQIPREIYVEQALRQVKLGLLLSALIKADQLTVNNEMLNEKLDEFTQDQEKAEADRIKAFYRQDERLISQLKALILEEQAVNKLLALLQLNKEKLSYQALMQLSE
jgi:trigger factor